MTIMSTTSAAQNFFGKRRAIISSTSASETEPSSSSSYARNSFCKSTLSFSPMLGLKSAAACSTAEPINRHHILKRVCIGASRAAFSFGLPSKIV